ncbi:alpha/beta fold hydrolase [Alkalicoccus daliensis]|uniref:Pimeloyl-ACP methyl ester carboxylesterase n=1 Tax=Alkalicoccus daliensis TaxID=745820 RepID=A0A1H0E6C5_9BACI|nr:alpha/beta hydrolase [Alkalicoccus daliensis]SDN77932.1 Pimeloyl-ACP methyl ester carboxylesterase [Alkalicoccus daliensis]
MKLNTHAAGEGEPLLLLHSGGMTGDTEYEEQSEYFSSRGYKVIRPDLRGHGKSAGEIDHYFSRTVEDLKDTLNALGIEKCHVAGGSIGGVAALLFAKAYSSRVKSVVFSGIFSSKPDNWENLLQEENESYEQLFQNEEAVTYLNKIHGSNDWKTLLRSFNDEDFYPFDQLKEAALIDLPALCLTGEEQELEVSSAVAFKQLNPHIRISVIPFAGHLVHRDQPDLYSRMLEYFLVHSRNKT